MKTRLYVILNTRNSNFAMRVNFITRTFHAAALARNNVMHCTSNIEYKVQNPRHKMQVPCLLAEPKTPLESSVFIGERERANLGVQLA